MRKYNEVCLALTGKQRHLRKSKYIEIKQWNTTTPTPTPTKKTKQKQHKQTKRKQNKQLSYHDCVISPNFLILQFYNTYV